MLRKSAIFTVLVLSGIFAYSNPYQGIRYATTEGKVYEHLSGEFSIAASTVSWSTYTITLDGADGSVTASSATFSGGIVAASATFSGPVVASTFTGSGSGLSGVIQSTATGNYLLRVATATYLATAPGACSAGEFISALTADGTKTCAAPAGGGDVVKTSTQTFTGANTFEGSVTVSSFTTSGSVSFNIPVGSSVTWSCPTGFTAVQSQGNMLGCIQNAEEGTTTPYSAWSNCFKKYGGQLPNFQQLDIAFEHYSLTDETDAPEWVADVWYTNGIDHYIVIRTAGGTPSYDSRGNNVDYRCWIPK